jgi:tRNA-splicing ligase RtcB
MATDGVRAVAIMPDAHLAEEVCVGTVEATRSMVLPAAIGGDIGCGVLARPFDGDAAVLRDERHAARIMAGLYRAVPAGRHARARPLPETVAGARLSAPRLASALERDGRVQLARSGAANISSSFSNRRLMGSSGRQCTAGRAHSDRLCSRPTCRKRR